jgi:hypothetical protein
VPAPHAERADYDVPAPHAERAGYNVPVPHDASAHLVRVQLGLRAWIGVALLAGSWLLGLSYYEPANERAWAVVLLVATLLLCVQGPKSHRQDAGAASPDAPRYRFTKETGLIIVSLLLLVPAIASSPWPYRAGPFLVAHGMAFWLLPIANPRLRSTGAGMIVAGLVLLAQSTAMTLYGHSTAHNHDLPWPAPQVVAGMSCLLGLDAVADGTEVVLRTVRQPHRLAVTWDLVFDPATLCFFLGCLVTSGAACYFNLPGGQRFRPWLRAARNLAIVVLGWLPLRLAVMIGLYVHRAVRSDYGLPLHVMDQFLSPWVHLLMLVPPVLLAGRFVKVQSPGSLAPLATSHSRRSPSPSPPSRAGALLASPYLPAGLVLLATALAALGLQWQPSGARKNDGRVTWVERHSTWSPTAPNGLGAGGTYDTEHFGGADEDASGYNYAVIYRYLGQFYEMGRIEEKDSIDDATLADCSVLVIKLPKDRYSPEEVNAVVRFVQRGGGLLLIGDHTDYERSSSHMNDITRHFGFTYRHDQLYSEEPAPDRQHYTASVLPHPAVQHVPEFDFAVSCSIDPGASRGSAAIQSGRLFSLPADYHIENYMPFAQHRPEMRYGPFVQAWTADHVQGRVLAWGDSTIFSNFCIHQPGKAELMLNMVEWLQHRAPPLAPCWPLLGSALLPLGAAVWLARRGASFQLATLQPGVVLLLIAAIACGWAAGSRAAVVLHRRDVPLPEALRPLPRVVIDRTTSQVPLATGAYNDDKQGQGYGLLEQWIPRLGYTTVRTPQADAFSSKALVVICPSLEPSPEFRERLIEYVSEGGRLLVFDSPEAAAPSTANSLLEPFGLAVSYEQAWQGDLQLQEKPLPVRVEQAREITGGERVASLGGQRTVCATARYGSGLVMAVGFGSLFNDARMGTEWSHKPNEQEMARYRVLFALVRALVEDRPVVVPHLAPVQPEIPEPKTELETPRLDAKAGGR